MFICLRCPFPHKFLKCFNLLLLMFYFVLQGFYSADVIPFLGCICTAVLPLLLLVAFCLGFKFCYASLQLLGLTSALLQDCFYGCKLLFCAPKFSCLLIAYLQYRESSVSAST